MSNRLTVALVGELDFEDIIYMEQTVPGGMGNDGGIVLEAFRDNRLVRYETNIYSDEAATDAAVAKLKENQAQFDEHYGGFGNAAFLRNSDRIVIDEKNGRFIFEHDGKQYPFSSSVPGVFKKVISSLNRSALKR